ncbi:host attachment family protein [Boseongicola sp. H5]|uniref:host attachment family protein n=1 Tax=Rhodobacterales TaxID=204455 RepID=UPI001D0A7C79|nr:host attachment family protein [Boseongicola sp. H5]
MTDPSMTPTHVDQVRRNPSPLTNGTWVLVADGEKALLCENIGDADHPLLEVRREDHQENPPNRDQGAHKPGRFNDGPSVHRSAVEDTDWHRLAQDRFAQDLSEMLYKRAHRHRFERLIIVAAPRILGELRGQIHKEVASRVIAELPMTLTNHPLDEVATRISARLSEDTGPPDA